MQHCGHWYKAVRAPLLSSILLSSPLLSSPLLSSPLFSSSLLFFCPLLPPLHLSQSLLVCTPLLSSLPFSSLLSIPFSNLLLDILCLSFKNNFLRHTVHPNLPPPFFLPYFTSFHYLVPLLYFISLSSVDLHLESIIYKC